jgi:methylglyoxal synthase
VGPKETRLIALVAHNNMKPTMMNFVTEHLPFFQGVSIVTTGSTGASLEKTLGLQIARKVASGPLGGDLEIGGMIANGEVAAAFFFIDPLSSHPHEADIRALTRICDVHNTASATNPWTGLGLVIAFTADSEFKESLSKGHTPAASDVVVQYKVKQQAVIAATAKAAFVGTGAAASHGTQVGARVMLSGTGPRFEGRTFLVTVVDKRDSDNTVKVQYDTGGFKRLNLDEFNALIPARVTLRGTGTRFEDRTFLAIVMEERDSDRTVKVQYDVGGFKRFQRHEYEALLVDERIASAQQVNKDARKEARMMQRRASWCAGGGGLCQ